MTMQRIRTIIDKEWAEVFKNRYVLFTVALLPLLFAALPLGLLAAMRPTGGPAAGDVTDLPPSVLEACGALLPMECMQVYIVNQFLILYMLMPLFIPIAIAAYSIVGEKTTRSLEPLLATPISTLELLAGKGLAAIIPAIVATWGAFLVFLIGTVVIGVSPAVVANLFSPVWWTSVIVVGPLLSGIAVSLAVIVSSRVTDPRAAEQISATLIVPILAVFFGQLAGVIILNVQFMLIAIGVLIAANAGLLAVGTRLFQRETILTKWK
jgi:ABC-2 type transport system permease protein